MGTILIVIVAGIISVSAKPFPKGASPAPSQEDERGSVECWSRVQWPAAGHTAGQQESLGEADPPRGQWFGRDEAEGSPGMHQGSLPAASFLAAWRRPVTPSRLPAPHTLA